MNRRKKILFLAASILAFGMGFLSTFRPETTSDHARVPVAAQVYGR